MTYLKKVSFKKIRSWTLTVTLSGSCAGVRQVWASLESKLLGVVQMSVMMGDVDPGGLDLPVGLQKILLRSPPEQLFLPSNQ